jgi:hypothetical protein
MMNLVLCESPQVRHPQEKCASKCVRRFCFSLPSSTCVAPKFLQGCRLTGKPSVSKTDILSSNLSVLAKSKQIFRKGSLTGKAVVSKTTALVACRFESCSFRQYQFWG